jgi:hypothetical protein
VLRRIKDGKFSRVVFAEGADDKVVDAHGMYPGSYGSAVRYAKNFLRGVDVRPASERSPFEPRRNPDNVNKMSAAYRVFGYGREGRIHAGMTVTVAGSGRKGRVVMPSSQPGYWVLNMGGRSGTPQVVHEDNIITRGG